MSVVQVVCRMLDVLLVQLQLQEAEPHAGLAGPHCSNTLGLALQLLGSISPLTRVVCSFTVPGPGLETVLERQQTTNTELQENLFILTQLLRNLLTFVLSEEQPEDREDETQV